MWPHFVHLLARIIHGAPGLVSSNWAASFLGLGAFSLTELLLYTTTPKEERVRRLRANLLIGVLVTIFVYSVLFVWSTIQTVYDEHHDSVGRWQAVVNEREQLKDGLKKRDEYITRLESKSCLICAPSSSRKPQVPQISVSPPETIHDILAEVRITCVLTNPSKMPEDLSLMFPSDNATYFEGASGKAYLQSRAASYKRTEEEGKATAIENFKLPPNSDLIGRPVSSLVDYSVLRISAISVGVKEFSQCVGAELALRVNGQEVLRTSSPMSAKMDGVHGMSFGVKLTDMKLPK